MMDILCAFLFGGIILVVGCWWSEFQERNRLEQEIQNLRKLTKHHEWYFDNVQERFFGIPLQIAVRHNKSGERLVTSEAVKIQQKIDEYKEMKKFETTYADDFSHKWIQS
jgi:hypothetical protein